MKRIMEKQKYYFIYQTTNKINGKIYIGKHETYNLEDGYIGSGKLLWEAIKKYGIENFERKILFFCENSDELKAKEKEIINEEFIVRKDTYNIKIGGDGGWDYVHKKATHDSLSKNAKKAWNKIKENPEKFNNFKLQISKTLKEKQAAGLFQNGFVGKQHKKETIKRIKESKRKNPQCGEKNSVYGTHWWKNLEGTESKMIKEGDPVPEGWIRGKLYSDAEKNAIKGKHLLRITDGIKIKQIYYTIEIPNIPEGWQRIFPKKQRKEKKELLSKEEISKKVSEGLKKKYEKDKEEKQKIIREMYSYYIENDFNFDLVKKKFQYQYLFSSFIRMVKKYADDIFKKDDPNLKGMKVYVSNGTITKYIERSNLQEYLNNGWFTENSRINYHPRKHGQGKTIQV